MAIFGGAFFFVAIGTQLFSGVIIQFIWPLIDLVITQISTRADVTSPQLAKAISNSIVNGPVKRGVAKRTMSVKNLANGLVTVDGRFMYIRSRTPLLADGTTSSSAITSVTTSPEEPLMNIYFFQWKMNGDFIESFMDRCREQYVTLTKNNSGKTKASVYGWSGESWRFGDYVISKNDDAIIGDVHSKAIRDVSNFYRNQEWHYDSNSVVRKKTYVLSGATSSGRSTIVEQVAATFEKPIFKVKLSEMVRCTGALRRALASANKNAIVVVEDDDDDNNKKTIGDLDTSYLEELTCTDDRVAFIITTNYEQFKRKTGYSVIADAVYEIGDISRKDAYNWYRGSIKELVLHEETASKGSLNEWRRIANAIYGSKSANLADRVILSPITPNTLLYDLVVYMSLIGPSKAASMLQRIKSGCGCDLEPLIELSGKKLNEELVRVSNTVVFEQLCNVIADEFATEICRKKTIERKTISKLNELLVACKWNPILLLSEVCKIEL
jgi:hypothetical protein